MRLAAADTAAYIAACPTAVRPLLEQLRATIRAAAPEAVETISYGMPAFRQGRVLVWFAAHTAHIGLYPTAAGIARFARELAAFKSSKGAVQFPLDRPLPLALVRRIVAFRVKEELERATVRAGSSRPARPSKSRAGGRRP